MGAVMNGGHTTAPTNTRPKTIAARHRQANKQGVRACVCAYLVARAVDGGVGEAVGEALHEARHLLAQAPVVDSVVVAG